MFLSERAIILFIEYISLSKSMSNDEYINILDVKSFIYKKTLGPLKIFKPSYLSDSINSIKTISTCIKNILYKTFYKTTEDFQTICILEDALENVCCLLSNISFKLNETGNYIFLENVLYLDKNTTKDNIFININIIRYKLELYYFLINNCDESQLIIDRIYKSLSIFITDNCIDNQLISSDVKLNTFDLYKQMIFKYNQLKKPIIK